MNDPALWSHDQDPPRDDALARQLRAADGTAPGQNVDWERLRTAIMRGADHVPLSSRTEKSSL